MTFKTVDLFAGPGGLAEGFSSLRDHNDEKVFEVALSVEKEPSAFATLRLRAFTRQFPEMPPAYYDYVSGQISKDELIELHGAEWEAAESETAMLELGTPSAQSIIDPILAELREDTGGRTVLIGGPPCQAYSLVGRARNKGTAGYVASDDHRHFLYKEYIRILNRLAPAAFVMENVKGMLSSKVEGESIVDLILEDLRSAGGGPDSYRLLPLVLTGKAGLNGNILRAEDFGIPQSRHRVILLGLRADLAARLPIGEEMPRLRASDRKVTVADVLGGMPRLRSGLSKGEDSEALWHTEVVKAFREAAEACRKEGAQLNSVVASLQSHAVKLENAEEIPSRKSSRLSAVRDNFLGSWLSDKGLRGLPNNETRGHMAGDLARYAFAATFAEVHGRSPRASEFPAGLAPDHRSWTTGKFADRFKVQCWGAPSSTITSHISKDGHYFIHPDPLQCRSLTVREAARLQTFSDNYFFEGNRTQQFVQVGNAVPPLLARQIAELLATILQRAFGGGFGELPRASETAVELTQ